VAAAAVGGLSALPLHLHITWQLQLCCFVLALAGWLAPLSRRTSGRTAQSPGAFDSANPPRRNTKEWSRQRIEKEREGEVDKE